MKPSTFYYLVGLMLAVPSIGAYLINHSILTLLLGTAAIMALITGLLIQLEIFD